ncbi:unnamed protein product, partial [Ectocarpus fasciculatus]
GNELPAANSRAHRTRSHGAQRSRTDPSLDGKGTKQASVQGNTTGWRALPAALAWVSQTALVFSNNTRSCCSRMKKLPTYVTQDTSHPGSNIKARLLHDDDDAENKARCYRKTLHETVRTPPFLSTATTILLIFCCRLIEP